MYSKSSVIKNLREERKKLEDILESVREFVLSREADIQLDLEDLGVLKPVLNYFLKEAERR